ncbi:MAG: glutamine-hydrolyzing GMP synthase, partial [Acidobacteriota bacterium]
MSANFETIIILDFGSQYTQLIARRVRELGVYCEIHPFHLSPDEIRKREAKGIILSGGPSSVYESGAPHCSPEILTLGIPVLGVCYGLQLLSYFEGGRVEPSARREYGLAIARRLKESDLLAGIPEEFPVWMSHGDHVVDSPPGYLITAMTENALGAVEDSERRIYGIQFHPEVAHT